VQMERVHHHRIHDAALATAQSHVNLFLLSSSGIRDGLTIYLQQRQISKRGTLLLSNKNSRTCADIGAAF